MNFCVDCFNDNEIKQILNTYSGQIGKCEICNKNNTKIFSSVEMLKNMFDNVIDYFSLLNNSNFRESVKEKKTIIEILCNDWKIFNVDTTQAHKILILICEEKYNENPSLFTEPVVIEELFDENLVNKYAILKNRNWDEFVYKIKHENRFHTGILNTENLDKLFNHYLTKTYSEGIEFFRGRISQNDETFSIDTMGAPPLSKTVDGRANFKGIRCLYLASNIETTIYEIKSRAHDNVTVGIFRAKREFKVIDMKKIYDLSPFHFIDENLLYFIINKEILEKISTEISRPLSRNDSDLDYLPTQYLSDYIKFKKFDGIEYVSTLNNNGYNIAMYNLDIFECLSIEQHKIHRLDYKFKKIE